MNTIKRIENEKFRFNLLFQRAILNSSSRYFLLNNLLIIRIDEDLVGKKIINSAYRIREAI